MTGTLATCGSSPLYVDWRSRVYKCGPSQTWEPRDICTSSYLVSSPKGTASGTRGDQRPVVPFRYETNASRPTIQSPLMLHGSPKSGPPFWGWISVSFCAPPLIPPPPPPVMGRSQAGCRAASLQPHSSLMGTLAAAVGSSTGL